MRMVKAIIGVTAVAGSFSLIAAIPAQASTPSMPRKIFHTGKRCKGVTSPKNFHGTVCVDNWIKVVHGGPGGFTIDAPEVTFSVRSGGISDAFVGRMWIRACSQLPHRCHRVSLSKNVSKNPHGAKTADIVGKQFDNPNGVGFSIQSMAVNICIGWTNGQDACYQSTLKAR